MRPIYLDCDPGVDDSLAIGFLLASPEVHLVGIGTVSGNVAAAEGARNALALLQLAGRSGVPVAVGAHDFLGASFTGGADWIHGANGLGNVSIPDPVDEPVAESAAELLIRLSHEHAGALEVVTVGPLTNVGLALRQDPTLPTRVRSITIMGGAALVPGNLTASAEANIGNDPEAAALVVSADWDLTLVPLDVTLENTLNEDNRSALLNADNQLANRLGEMLDFYFDFYTDLYGHRGSALHDPLAAAIAVGAITPTNAPAIELVVDDTQGPGRGRTIADLRGQRLGPVDQPGRRTRVVLDTDQPFGPLLIDRLTSYTGGSAR